jgi:prepilin-type N-terminal cleavage/methylation domain-containing protein
MLKNQRGDTLIEVLISIAIISTVLGAAYATVSRSFRTGTQSTERGEALRLVENQLELLKAGVKKAKGLPTNPVISATGDFCLNSSGAISGSRCTQGLYSYWLSKNPKGAYIASAEWDSYGYGVGGKDRIELTYLIDKDSY